jgi:hypothetical protein
MTKEFPMTNNEACQWRFLGHSGFDLDSSFIIRHSSLFFHGPLLPITEGQEPANCCALRVAMV